MAKKYRYTGSQPHNATIRVNGKNTDLKLSPGLELDLPDDHPHIKTLVSTGHLVEANNIAKK